MPSLPTKRHLVQMIKSYAKHSPRTLTAFFALLLAAVMLALPGEAFAANPTPTLGGVIRNVGEDIWRPVMLLFGAGSILGGLFLVSTALLRMAQNVGREGESMKDPILRLAGGGFLFGFMDTIQMGPATLWGAASSAIGLTPATTTPSGVQDCLGANGGVTCMAANFSGNVVPVFMSVAFSLAFVWGAWMVVTAIHSIATSGERGGRQEGKPGARLLFGAIMCQLALFSESISRTLGFNRPIVNGVEGMTADLSMLSYVPPTNFGMLSPFAQLIGHVFIIMAMFGIIAIWRGISFLKADADGSQRGVVGAGVTHLIGGALLLNSKATTCFMMNTVLGNSLGFCN